VKSKTAADSSGLQTDDITDRLILQMLNESIACLREGVVEDQDLLDVGMIFGTGFAPFLGGPMHYMEQRGRLNTEISLRQMRVGKLLARVMILKYWHKEPMRA